MSEVQEEQPVLHHEETSNASADAVADAGAHVGPASATAPAANPGEFEIPATTKTYSHFQSYPIAASWIKIGGWFPIPHIFRPRLYNLAYSPNLRNYTMAVDDYVDHWLDGLDEVIPETKTLRMRDIRDTLTQPVVDASLFVDRNMHHLSEVVEQRLLQPVKRTASDVRKAYAPVYDNNGRALVRSQLDPIVKPVNERLAAAIGEPAAETEANKDNEFSSELSHTVSLLNEAVSKGRPVVVERLSKSRELPTQATKHMSEVFETNKSKRGEGRLIVMIASMDTARDLLNEGYSFVNGQEPASESKTAPLEDAPKAENEVPPEL